MKIKAGKTNVYCGTRVRITYINDDDPEEKFYEEATGTITHPFPGLMSGPYNYIAGVNLDPEWNTYGRLGITNLIEEDRFEVIDESTAIDYPNLKEE